MTAVRDAWHRIESWGKAHAEGMLTDLNTGASDEKIAELQQALGRSLPESFLESLRIHDGESDGWPSRVFADMGAYLGSDRIVEYWRMRVEIAKQVGDDFELDDYEDQIREGIIFVEGPVRPAAYDEDWVPFMDCNGDVFWALDFAPREGGTQGQVIQVDLEGVEWKVIAESFDAFLADYAKRLESEEWKFRNGVPTKYEL